MHSTPNPEQTDPTNVFAHVNEEIARAYEQIALADEQISKLAHDDARHPSDDPQTRMNTLRPAVLGRRPSPGRPALRGLIVFLLAACIFVAAFVSQTSYGDAAKLIIARWAPQLIVASSLPLERPGLLAQPSPSTVQVAAAKADLPQSLTQTAPEGVAPTVTLSPESAQLLQSMARDLATEGQEIGQLKASIEQLHASVEQLKAGQEQMSRDIAKASEQNLRPKTSVPPPRPIATPARKPAPTLPSQQARQRRQAPMQLPPEDQ